ncbi:unnamed protein product [Rhizophagus irregularis]|nr:unnamed protein product [Rhizophagus irregularis]
MLGFHDSYMIQQMLNDVDFRPFTICLYNITIFITSIPDNNNYEGFAASFTYKYKQKQSLIWQKIERGLFSISIFQYDEMHVPGDDELWYRILIVGTYLIRAMDPKGGIETISNLFSNGFLNSTLNSTIRNDEFENFAENFTYEELMKNLQHKGFRRYANVYSYLNSNGVPLRNYTVATSLTTLVMCIELLLLLRFFSGPANYINISLSIIRRINDRLRYYALLQVFCLLQLCKIC